MTSRKLMLLGALLSSINLFGQSAFFNGPEAGARIRITNENPINENANPAAYQITGTNITVEAWVYPLGFPDPDLGSHIVSSPISPAADPWKMYGLSVNHSSGQALPEFTISSGAPGTQVGVVSSTALSTFTWTHVAGTYDGENLKIYLDGNLQGSTASNMAIDSAGVGFYIGRFMNDRFFGLIDDVRLWNITRSQSEIQQNMLTVLDSNELGLAGYWTLDGSSAELGIAVDKSINHNDLYLQSVVSFPALVPGGASQVADISNYPGSLNYGSVEQATSVTQIFNLSNTSSIPLIGVSRIDNDNFSVDRLAGFIIPPASTGEVYLSLSCLLAGTQNESIIIESNAVDQVSIPFSIESIALQNLDANNINMWVQRDGRFARDPFPPRHAGFYWPKEGDLTSIFASGVWVGAKVNNEVRSAVAEYGSEFQAGPIKGDGTITDPANNDYRVYKIALGDDASSNIDYAEWPVELAAPVTINGTPLIIGSQILYQVYNDLDPTRHYDVAGPLGLEVQQISFAFDAPGVLSNTVFVAFRIINKSTDIWDDAYLTLWSDPDIGNAYDDLVGIDTLRNMAYAYNGDAFDEENTYNTGYGDIPPAVGYKLLKGSFYTKPIQSFAVYTAGADYPFNDPSSPEEFYNNMEGRLLDGSSRLDPQTGQTSIFPFSGMPETGSGWIDTDPADRRFLLSTGPFDLDPGQSRELVAAILVAQGTDHISSIAALRIAADELQILYESGAVLGGILQDVVSLEIPAGNTAILDEVENLGMHLSATSTTEGATVEVASFQGDPPATADIRISGLARVGKSYDVQTIGEIEWPVEIKIYYTDAELAAAGILEADLLGLSYWNGTQNKWIQYSESGADDQNRGISISVLHTDDISIGGTQYAGYVSTTAYHLTPMVLTSIYKGPATGLESESELIPDMHILLHNFPNPFNPMTNIRYGLAEDGDVHLVVYDISGREVRTLVQTSQIAGWHTAHWDGKNQNGQQVSGGMYFARLQAGDFSNTIKMVFLK